MPEPALDETRLRDAQFVVLRDVYGVRGGLWPGEDVASRHQDRDHRSHAALAKMIVARQVISLEWRGAHWVPMFQFDRKRLQVLPAVDQVRAELPRSFDGWALAVWFATANTWLHERLPADVLQDDLPAVLAAARSDRWIALG